jgi:uncharacterized protein (DUF433 family)
MIGIAFTRSNKGSAALSWEASDWVLKGTRMPVSAIFENLEAGANIDDIMQWYAGLDREQVKAVIEFAVRSLDRLPEYAA